MSDRPLLSERARRAGGQPIGELMHRALSNPRLVSLAAGFVDQATLPVEATREAFEALLSDDLAARAALQYGTTAGYAPLREALLARLRKMDATPDTERNLSIEQVVITAGSNQLLHLICEALLDPGDIVICGAPTYFVFMGTLNTVGARSVGVAVDRDGMIPAALEAELARREKTGELARVKAIYIGTDYENPSTAQLSRERRPQIVEIARRWSRPGKDFGKIHVIDDAAYRELRYRGDDIPSLRAFDPDGDTVILAGTFSKSFSPGLRVGWGILPPHLFGPICELKGNIDFGSPNLSQQIVARVLERDLFDPHVKQLREGYRKKLDAMLTAADEFLAPLSGVSFERPKGGLYVWLKLPEHIDTGPAGPLFDRAIAEGMLYVPGQFCYPAEGEPVHHNMIRLSFGVQSCEGIRRGIAALAKALKQTT
jgi:2-aminoadipate transaminase